MAAYQAFMEEKSEIDKLMAEGFVVVSIHENLDGALVRFQSISSTEQVKSLHLNTADARKYISTLLWVKQRKI
ncbi:hypothetical protein [Paenibacillus agricola]|uniref:Uncharacterized protein n=1 Tax=Paenibacillus agricola TaxID=2716264 RepID=A0ABX0JH59_9BACL|nr:hypothetical protein [Paenibacillus agricola]NHN35288.1 hypothetical protein [Paenibacillus agricola]